MSGRRRVWKGLPGLVAIVALWVAISATAQEAPAAQAVTPNGAPEKAAPEQVFDVPWWSVDGGGAVSFGGAWVVTSAIGQPDVGGAHKGYLALDGGVWSVALEAAFFCDGFETGGTSAWSAVVGAGE